MEVDKLSYMIQIGALETLLQWYLPFVAKFCLLCHTKGLKCQLNNFEVSNRVVIFILI